MRRTSLCIGLLILACGCKTEVSPFVGTWVSKERGSSLEYAFKADHTFRFKLEMSGTTVTETGKWSDSSTDLTLTVESATTESNNTFTDLLKKIPVSTINKSVTYAAHWTDADHVQLELKQGRKLDLVKQL